MKPIDYLRKVDSLRYRHVSLSILPQQEMDKLCTRTVYDENGCPHTCLDEYMKSRLENKLIRAMPPHPAGEREPPTPKTDSL
ncbi:MAG: helix-turn-helix domain-containing protein [Acutalibacter sp.]|nr:helix-turn-helix domain-containing protein [Acutalibacter sp.]